MAGPLPPPSHGERWTQTFSGPRIQSVGDSRSVGRPGTAENCVGHHHGAPGRHRPGAIQSAITLDSVTDGESLDGYDDVDRFHVMRGRAGDRVGKSSCRGRPVSWASRSALSSIPSSPGAVVGRQRRRRRQPGGARIGQRSPLRGRARTGWMLRALRNGCRDGFGNNDPYLGPYRLLVYRIDNPPPGVHPDSFAVGDTISGEAIDRIGDVDVFRLRGTPGSMVDLLFQVPDGGLQHELQMTLNDGVTSNTVYSFGGDATLDAHASGRFVIPPLGHAVIRVSGVHDGRGGDAAPYRVYAYPINSSPEHIPAAITPGDTVIGEAVDHVGDVDEFTFPATAGQQFNGFLQASGASWSATLTLQVLGPDSRVRYPPALKARGADTSLFTRATRTLHRAGDGHVHGARRGFERSIGNGRWALPLSHLSGQPGSGDRPRGAGVRGQCGRPSASTCPGTWMEFHVVVPDSSDANLVLTPDSNAFNLPLQLVLIDSTHGTEVLSYNAAEAGIPQQSFLTLAPGHYIVRVQGGYDSYSLYQGGYSIKFYKFSHKPETVSDTVAIGDTVVGEAINPPGDDDRYVLFGKKGQHVNLALEGQGAASPGSFYLSFANAPNGPYFFLYSPTSPDSLNAHRTNRIDLPVTGPYQILVSGDRATFPLAAPGPYTLAVEPVPVGPEHAAATLAVGDSVTNEAIDYPGDWDEFTLTGTPGQSVAVSFTIAGVTGNPVLEVFDSTADSVVATAVGQAGVQVAGPAVMPASGQLVIRVYEPRPGSSSCTDTFCNGIFAYTGGYKFTTAVVP